MMKCYCEDTGTRFVYVVEDAPPETEETILKAFYEKYEDRFVKAVYPSDIPDKDTIIKNYERLAPGMFLRKHFSWENALEQFCRIAKENSIDYIITGSITACIRGVDIIPDDIDILVDVGDFDKIKTLFYENMIEPFLYYADALLLVKYSGRLCIGEVRLDISAYPKEAFKIGQIETVCWNGHIIKAQSLFSCLETYKRIGRDQHVKKIESFLANS